MNITIESMSLLDLENIKDILNSDFDNFWNYNILQEELQISNSKYLIAKINDEIVGFAGIKIVLDEADLMNIVTKKAYRNNGIGKLLLKNLISLSQSLSLKTITLEVNEENEPAIHLYKSLGFKKIGNRKNYYQNNSAILLCLYLQKV